MYHSLAFFSSYARIRDMRHPSRVRAYFFKPLLIFLIVFFLGGGSTLVWAMVTPIPDFNTYFEQLRQEGSTKIYDRTGTIVLYDVHGEVQKTITPLDQISAYLKNATIAIEDEDFYNHGGIKPSSIVRALWVDITSGSLKQGGSTITQQVVKNLLLSQEKTFSRKLKEAVLAIKMEKTMSKNDILELYLNENPYGGALYGVKEAAEAFFREDVKNVTLPEAAYIAAVAKAPTFYSPYGSNRARLDDRKNLILDKMAEQGYVTKEEAKQAKETVVEFAPPTYRGIRAPHFVFYIKNYLEEKYGKDMVENGGLKVITTLDWSLEQKAEDIVKTYGDANLKNNNARNASMVAIDPTTGQILVMVGSRDYYDVKNEGNFNVALAHRQPGSSFKPFVYATAFNKGYTPETILFDVPTEFNPSCNPALPRASRGADCYNPVDFDGKYLGPLTLRQALAQSRNVPAVKLIYLAGVTNSINTAKAMGINSLKDKNTYGLTLVLGGGEVSLLEMTSAYGVFAADGIRHPYQSILEVRNQKGTVLEHYEDTPTVALPANTARQISSVLSDNIARQPSYAPNSPLYFPDRPVAAKTGTTNDYRDTWILGYTPHLVVGAWAGNNDNSSMGQKVAGYVVAPMWNAFMKQALAGQPAEPFLVASSTDQTTLKPILRGVWQDSQPITIDRTTGKPANLFTLPGNLVQKIGGGAVHTILYYINKNDPLGPPPTNPEADPQYKNWQYGIDQWLNTSD